MRKFSPESKLKKGVFTESEIQEFHLNFIENKSVLGIDIYKYSEYPENAQVYVPLYCSIRFIL